MNSVARDLTDWFLHATSEWNFGAWSEHSAEIFYDNVKAFESRRVAYTGWQYLLSANKSLGL